MCKWGVSRRENDSTVSNATGADTDRKREKIQRLRDRCLIEGVASSLVRPANEQKLTLTQHIERYTVGKKKISSGYNVCNKKEKEASRVKLHDSCIKNLTRDLFPCLYSSKLNVKTIHLFFVSASFAFCVFALRLGALLFALYILVYSSEECVYVCMIFPS